MQIQDRSPESRPLASLSQSQTQLTRPVATGLGMQHAPDLSDDVHFLLAFYLKFTIDANIVYTPVGETLGVLLSGT